MENKIFDLNVTVNVRPDTRRANKLGKNPVKLIVTYQRKKKLYSIGMSLTPVEWDKMQLNNLKEKNLIERRQEIESIKTKATKFIKQLGDNFTYELFEQFMFGISKNIPSEKKDVFAEIELKIEELRKSKQYGSADNYERTFRALKKHVTHLEFSPINVAFLKGWEEYQKNNRLSTYTRISDKSKSENDKDKKRTGTCPIILD